MDYYALHDLTVQVWEEGGRVDILHEFLREFACTEISMTTPTPNLHLTVHRNRQHPPIPLGHRVFQTEGFEGFEDGPCCSLTYDTSWFALQPMTGYGDAHLSPSFFDSPSFVQHKFFAFGLLRLLQPHGLFSVHAAGLVTPKDEGLLLMGPSGSGKSTLAIGLIRQGWRYLSDDSVLLRQHENGIEALGFRTHCYIDAEAASRYTDLELGAPVSDTAGGRRQRVLVEARYADQLVRTCRPSFLLFPRIVPERTSQLQPVTRQHAMRYLLGETSQQVVHHSTIKSHLQILTDLLYQTAAYELQAGEDLYHDPLILERLLAHV